MVKDLTSTSIRTSLGIVSHRSQFTQSLCIMSRFYEICCPEHPEANLIEDYAAGDQICSACGLVVGDRVIDVGSEWRTFSSSDGNANGDPSRVGAAENPLLNGLGLTTIVGPSLGSSSSSGATSYQSRRSGNSSNKPYGSNKVLLAAFKQIGTMADRLNMPKTIVDSASLLFKQAYEGKSIKGRTNDASCAACLYIACRQDGVPRTFKEICAVSKVTKKDIGRMFKIILKGLETSVELINTGDFMSRFCSNLGLPINVQKAATHIAKRCAETDIVPGRSPITVVAAAIYMASQASEVKKSQNEIGEVSGVAEGTIKQVYKKMLPQASGLFPDKFVFHTPIEQLPQL